MMKIFHTYSEPIRLLSLVLSSFLLGSNLVIDLLAIPINFRLPEHTGEVAAAYGLALFTSFFRIETVGLVLLILLQIIIFSLRYHPQRLKLLAPWLHLASILILIVYLVVQRNIHLPEFEAQVLSRQGPIGHGTLVRWEQLKVAFLFYLVVSQFRELAHQRSSDGATGSARLSG